MTIRLAGLAFVVIAFVGTGVYQGYGSLMADDNATVAKIDGRKLTRSEWEFAQREQIGVERHVTEHAVLL